MGGSGVRGGGGGAGISTRLSGEGACCGGCAAGERTRRGTTGGAGPWMIPLQDYGVGGKGGGGGDGGVGAGTGWTRLGNLVVAGEAGSWRSITASRC